MVKNQLSGRTLTWLAAIAASLVGASLVYDAHPGLNWGLWVLSASAAVAINRLLAHGAVERPLVALLSWATLLALGVAITANEFFHVLIILSDAMLLGLAVIAIGATRWRTLSVELLPTVPFLAPLRVLQGSVREIADVPSRVSTLRTRPLLRGILLALPLALIVLGLLRDADPIIAWGWTGLERLIPDWSISGRVAFFFFLLAVTLGAASTAARQNEARLPTLPRASISTTVGAIEQQTILVTLAAILWLFVVLQVTYFIHPPPSAVGSGVTFAEYARKGFAELSIAVTLVAAVLIVLARMRPKDISAPAASGLPKLEIVLLVALELVLLSAFRRVLLYEEAYGFTTSRLYAQAYMVAMAIGLALFWVDIRGGGVTVDLGRRLAVVALGTLTLLVFWNHEAWIADRNIDRVETTGKFDADYLRQLSANAIPVVLTRRSELPEPQRAAAEQWAACRVPAHDRRWFEFNLRLEAARRAVSSAGLRCARPSPQINRPAQSQKPERVQAVARVGVEIGDEK